MLAPVWKWGENAGLKMRTVSMAFGHEKGG